MADSPEEKAHWREVIQSFDGYMQYHLSANHARRTAFLSLSKEDKAMYEAIGFRDKLEAVDEGIRRNAEFIDELSADPVFADMLSTDAGDEGPHEHSHDHDHGHSHSHAQSHTHSHSHGGHASQAVPVEKDKATRQADMNLAQDKIRSTLRSFVRDWSVEGQVERDACYTPILSALENRFGADADRAGKRVLVPGTGLGRLAMEIAARGFSAQGNEFSTYMLIASNYILNQTSQPFAHGIFPYLHSFSNHLSTEAHLLQKVLIPDIVPAEALAGVEGEFSLVAGDFEEVYGGAEQKGQWAAVTTCFFIDCARNVLSFLRIIYDLLEPGGVWINLGPLLWHFENSPSKGAKGEGSIELSLDEVKALARNVGFDISDERMVRSSYTGIPEGMLRHEYNAAFWTATKRTT